MAQANELNREILTSFSFNGITITYDSFGDVRVNDRMIPLSQSQTAVLMFLLENPGKVFQKEDLMKTMYADSEHVPTIKIIDVFVCLLRKNLSKANENLDGLIQTVWGRGYCVGTPIAESGDDALVTGLPEDRLSQLLKNSRIQELYGSIRWTVRIKALAVELVHSKIVTLEELLLLCPGLSRVEFLRWRRVVASEGWRALQITRFHMEARTEF